MRVRLLVVEEEVEEEVVEVRRRTCKIDFQEIKASETLSRLGDRGISNTRNVGWNETRISCYG